MTALTDIAHLSILPKEQNALYTIVAVIVKALFKSYSIHCLLIL